jgi:serine/threonine-protein kinase
MRHLQPNTTLQGGKYRIERVLGQGGFGITYLATQTSNNRQVAIKELFIGGSGQAINDRRGNQVVVTNAANQQSFNQQKAKFKKEALRLSNLNHSNLVKVHEFFEENGTAYYVMDFIDGESLAEKMKKTGQPFTEAEVRSILSQILEALKEVHQNEIWHLDLKPGNIMIDKGGNAYLIDFGASKQLRANGSMTTSTALCYTPGYAPNEQIGQMYDRFGPWTDIYALGATVYNLLTNNKPPMPIDIEEDEEEAFVFPTIVSEEMRKIVFWMMQPKRKARPQSVEEIQSLYQDQDVEEAYKEVDIYNNEETFIEPPKEKKETVIDNQEATQSISEETILDINDSFGTEDENEDNSTKNGKPVMPKIVPASNDKNNQSSQECNQHVVLTGTTNDNQETTKKEKHISDSLFIFLFLLILIIVCVIAFVFSYQ